MVLCYLDTAGDEIDGQKWGYASLYICVNHLFDAHLTYAYAHRPNIYIYIYIYILHVHVYIHTIGAKGVPRTYIHTYIKHAYIHVYIHV